MKRSCFVGIIFAAAILGTWHYAANGAPETNYEENTLPTEDLQLKNEMGNVENDVTVQSQDSIVLDAEKCKGSYSKTFVVSKDTKIPISTTVTIEFTCEDNDNGGYSIVSVDSAKAENNSGWTCVSSEAAVNGDILYSNERRQAAIPIAYQASLGDGLRPQECLILLDLLQEQ